MLLSCNEQKSEKITNTQVQNTTNVIAHTSANNITAKNEAETTTEVPKKIVPVEKWEYGFGLNQSGKPVCFDVTKSKYNTFYRYIPDIDEITGDMVTRATITIRTNAIVVCNGKKEVKYSAGFERSYINNPCRYYKHKFEDNTNYISADGINWDTLEIPNLKITNETSPLGEPMVLVYFKCKYFQGSYYIVFGE